MTFACRQMVLDTNLTIIRLSGLQSDFSPVASAKLLSLSVGTGNCSVQTLNIFLYPQQVVN